MKSLQFLFCISSLVFFLSSKSLGQSTKEPIPSAKEDLILENLIEGANSGNRGCCASSVYLMGELCGKGAVIPLLKIIHNGKCEEVRIMAALSLYKINDARGIFAIKQAAKFDDSERVRRICSIFFNAHLNRDKINNQQMKNIAISE